MSESLWINNQQTFSSTCGLSERRPGQTHTHTQSDGMCAQTEADVSKCEGWKHLPDSVTPHTRSVWAPAWAEQEESSKKKRAELRRAGVRLDCISTLLSTFKVLSRQFMFFPHHLDSFLKARNGLPSVFRPPALIFNRDMAAREIKSLKKKGYSSNSQQNGIIDQSDGGTEGTRQKI